MQFYRQDMQAKVSRMKFGKIFIHLPGDNDLTDYLGSQPRINHNWPSAQGSYLTSSFSTQRFSNVKSVLSCSSLWMLLFHYSGEWSKQLEDHRMVTSEGRCWGPFSIFAGLSFLCGAIIDPHPIISGSLAYLLLELGHGWINIPYEFIWM